MRKKNATIRIEGMSCDHCVRTVRGALESAVGFDVVDVGIGSARIVIDPDVADLEAAKRAIDETGFEVVEIAVE